MNSSNILDLPMGHNDAGASTIRDYLCCLLPTVWEEGEGFSGKRPFGNSGWENELYETLAKWQVIDGVENVDCDGNKYWDGYDKSQGRDRINECILEMCGV